MIGIGWPIDGAFYREGMATTWVLHTETKGTGAQVVPLETVKKRSSGPEPVYVRRKPDQTPEPEAPEPTQPRRFRIVDLMTRQLLIDGGSTREAIDALTGVRSVVDVNMYVWDEERRRWRLLTFAEQSVLLDYAHQRPSTRASRFRVSATTRGSGARGASGEALGTGSSPSSQPSVPVANTIAPERAV